MLRSGSTYVFDYCSGLTMTNQRFSDLFNTPDRAPNDLLTPYPSDIAASIQAVLEEIVLRITRSLAKQTGARDLCIAGGVGLDCVANGKILRDSAFEKIWIQPAAGDAGGAVGAASQRPTYTRATRANRMVAIKCMGIFLARAIASRKLNNGLPSRSTLLCC